MSAFAQSGKAGLTTMSELLRVHDALRPDEFFGCYAYATQSGFRAFELNIAANFWKRTSSRWLFGIDYGRTDPRALREIAKRPNVEVRICDGAWVVDQEGFAPRRDYHAKAAFMTNTKSKMLGLVLGSGNFSYNGLINSVEAGASFAIKAEESAADGLALVKLSFEDLWKQAAPLADLLEEYASRRKEQVSQSDKKKPPRPAKPISAFWIEAGYVTKNRGRGKPGNQIWFPIGFRSFLGFTGSKVATKNAVIGQVTFEAAVGPSVTRDLRLNGNGMEKVSLPFPESHGFGVYDGKILVFQPAGGAFRVSAFEPEEFELMYGHRVADIQRMKLGRRYGAIV